MLYHGTVIAGSFLNVSVIIPHLVELGEDS